MVSDFGLNDAIESGLVKTPRVVVRDDGEQTSKYKSKFYHIYTDPEVKTDLNRKAEPHIPLPDLVGVGYYFLGKDWLETVKKWREEGRSETPVMITVANLTNTAARVQYAFEHKKIRMEELCDPEKILHIDSKVLDEAEAQDEPVSQLKPQRLKSPKRKKMRKCEELAAEEEADQETTRRVDAQDGGHDWTRRAAGRAHSERNFGGHALRRLGRQKRDAHYGAAGVYIATLMRTGCRAWLAPNVLRRESGNRLVSAGIRKHFRSAVYVSSARGQRGCASSSADDRQDAN